MLNLKKLATTLTVFTMVLGATMFLVPDQAWASANPCNVRCLTNNFFLDCTWGGSWQDQYCCYTNPWIGCQAYWCATGVPILTKFLC